MPSYLVESFLAASPTAVVDARRSAERAAVLGEGVRYVRTTYIPDDEVVLHIFEAPSADAVGTAGRRADLAYDRIVEAVDA